MQEDERLRDFSALLEAIEHSRSAFGQWHALYLAQLILPNLSPEQRQELEAMLTERPANAHDIRPGTDRWAITRHFLARLTTPSD